MELRFYKKESRWFCYLPKYIASGGTEADCEMVAGADTWLDYLSNNGDEITLDISKEIEMSNRIDRVHEDGFGATYMAYEYNEKPINHQLWICPVTLFVFNEYPQTIYYKIV